MIHLVSIDCEADNDDQLKETLHFTLCIHILHCVSSTILVNIMESLFLIEKKIVLPILQHIVPVDVEVV